MAGMAEPVSIPVSVTGGVDLRVTNGRIWNGEQTTPRPLDMLVSGGRVLALGEPGSADVARETIDLDGSVLSPGGESRVRYM